MAVILNRDDSKNKSVVNSTLSELFNKTYPVVHKVFCKQTWTETQIAASPLGVGGLKEKKITEAGLKTLKSWPTTIHSKAEI